MISANIIGVVTILKTVCAWCGVVIRNGVLPITHGICIECQKKIDAEIVNKERR